MTTDVGVTAESISIGILADLSGPRAIIDVPVVDAYKLYWAEANRAGGVGGRVVELTVIDTSSDIEAHRAGYRELVDDVGVVAIGYSSGTGTTQAVGPLASTDGLLVVSGSRHSSMISYDAVLAPHTSLCVEAMNAVSWLDQRVRAVTDDQIRLAIVGDGTPDADDAVAGARLAAVALDLQVVIDHTGTGDLAARLENSNATGVFAAGEPGFLEIAMSSSTQAGTADGSPATWTGSSLNLDVYGSGSASASALISENYFHPWSLSVLGSGSDDVDRVAEVLAASTPLVSNWSLTGWASASLLFEALDGAASRGDMQRQTVLEVAGSNRTRFDGLAPDQTWRGNRADRIVRETVIYDVVDWGQPEVVQLVPAGGPDPSEVAVSHRQEGACLAPPVPPPATSPTETTTPDTVPSSDE